MIEITKKRDEAMLVWMRNAMIEQLVESVAYYNEYDVKAHITDTLKRIANTEGYKVDMYCNEKFHAYGVNYNQPHIKITEADEGFTVRMFRMKQGNIVVDYDAKMLMTKEEREIMR